MRPFCNVLCRFYSEFFEPVGMSGEVVFENGSTRERSLIFRHADMAPGRDLFFEIFQLSSFGGAIEHYLIYG